MALYKQYCKLSKQVADDGVSTLDDIAQQLTVKPSKFFPIKDGQENMPPSNVNVT